MYRCTLDIRIFSHDANLVLALRGIAPLEHFEHSLAEYQAITPDDVSKGDLLILDLPFEQGMEVFRKHCKPGARVVLCATAEERMALSASELQEIDAIWTKPFTPDLINFDFRNLLAEIQSKKDCRLYQIYLETAMDSLPDLIWFKDVRGSHVKVNLSFCRAVGKERKDVEGRGHYYIWDLKKEEYEQGEYVCLETDEAVMRARKTCLFEERVKSKQGMRQLCTYKSPLFDDDGNLMGTVGVAQDMTELANRGVELDTFLDNMPFSLVISNNEDLIIKVNKKFENAFNTPAKKIMGMPYQSWRESVGAVRDSSGRSGYAEVEIGTGNGTSRIMELHEEPLFDVFKNPMGRFCICRDITLERTFEQSLLQSANTDPLTGLFNRRFFFDYVNAHRGLDQISLMYVDMDNFKQINDLLGHKIGDETLTALAEQIQKLFPDDLAVRLGGDEFVICLIGPHDSADLEHQAAVLLEKIQRNVLSPEMSELKASASIGIAWTRDPEMELDDLLKQSDVAMYEAKQHGKCCYALYSPSSQTDPL